MVENCCEKYSNSYGANGIPITKWIVDDSYALSSVTLVIWIIIFLSLQRFYTYHEPHPNNHSYHFSYIGFTSDRAFHYSDVIMGTMESQITNLTIVYSTVYSGTDQRKHQCSPSLAFVPGIHRWPVNFPHKGPVTRKMFPFDDIIMWWKEAICKIYVSFFN